MDDEIVQAEPEAQDVPQDESLTNEEPQVEAEVAAPAEEEPVEVEEESDDDSEPYRVSAPQMAAPLLDFSKIPQNEDGTLDAEALAQAMQQRDQSVLQQAAQMVQQVEEARAEEKQWMKAFDKHPELKTDKELAKEVQALRFGLFASEIESGREAKMLSPAQAYSRLNKRFGQAKADGVKMATESVRVQESAYVEPTQNAQKSTKSEEDNLFQAMRSPDRYRAEAAQAQLLKQRLFGGN